MDPNKRNDIRSRAASVPPPSLTPQIPGAPAPGRGYEVVPDESSTDDPAKVQASKRGAHLPPGTVRSFGGSQVTMTEGGPTESQNVRVRGAAPVAGPQMGASVRMHGAGRPTGARGATMVEHGQPVQPLAGIGPQPTRQIATPSQAPNRAWGGAAAIPSAAPTAAAAPVIDLTIMLSQRARPTLFVQQRQAIDTSTVRPAALACFVNPVGVQLNDRAMNGIATIKAGYDMGPWMRWRFAQETETKYVLVLDDDCIPGINWIRCAYERLELAEQRGEKIVVGAGGTVYQSDNYDDVFPVGPEAPRVDEVLVDIVRGGWMMPRELITQILEYPRLGSTPGSQRLAVPIHVSAALQDIGYQIVVLSNSPADKASWGMREPPTDMGSTSQMIDEQAKQNRDYPSSWYRADVYAQYRAAGWEPIEVRAASSTTQLHQSDFAKPSPTPAPPPPPVAPLAKGESKDTAP